MPVKRRNAKARNLQITAEMVELFKEAVASEPTYHGCKRATSCLSASANEHCADCLCYLDSVRQLHRLLKLPPWSVSPTDPDLDGEMPDYMRDGNLCSKDTWAPAQEIRAELKKLAKRTAT